jgi:hypothetical protein
LTTDGADEHGFNAAFIRVDPWYPWLIDLELGAKTHGSSFSLLPFVQVLRFEDPRMATPCAANAAKAAPLSSSDYS